MDKRPGNRFPSLEEIAETIGRFAPDEEPGPRARTRRRIVTAATSLFIKHGYRKTSVDEIAREAGVAKGTVYLHVSSKVELLLQAVAEEKKRQLGKLAPLLAEGLAPSERLRRYIQMAMVMANEMPLSSRLLSGDREMMAAMEELDPDRRDTIRAQQTDFLVRMLAPAHATVDPVELQDRARALMGLLFTAPFADRTMRGELPLERYAELVAGILVDGLAGGHAPIDTAGERG